MAKVDFSLRCPRSPLRAAITAATRRAETEAVPPLVDEARLAPPRATAAQNLAHRLAQTLRDRKSASGRAGLVQDLLQEYALSSQEGVALMCLAEALLRIPDARDARRADPRQDRHRPVARASRPEPVAVRQRGDLGACCSPASSSRRTARRASRARSRA